MSPAFPMFGLIVVCAMNYSPESAAALVVAGVVYWLLMGRAERQK